jgi:glycosyltransferase involved in cell wall biosynthesis
VRIGLDATPLISPTGGVPRYVRELHSALRELGGADEFELFTDQPVDGAIGPRNSALEKRWWLAGLPLALRRHRIDVFHGTEFSVPYLPVVASVMSINDLSPWLNPEWHATSGRVRRRTPILLRLGLATMVLTLSEAVRRQAIKHFSLDPTRVIAVPLAAAETFRPVNVPTPSEPYFLYVGAIEPRKNLPLLVEAWREIRKRHRVRLVIAGRRREDGPRIDPTDGLELLGAVDESKLPALYSGALAVVYPTLYEGFGLPIVEAMQCGAPVITSEDESVVEVSGGAAVHASATDTKDWIAAMTRLIEDATLRQSFIKQGLERASAFSWQRTARETLAVYREAHRRFR